MAHKNKFDFNYVDFVLITAVEKGVTSLALTNINSSCDLWEFVCLCDQHHMNRLAELRCEMKILFCIY